MEAVPALIPYTHTRSARCMPICEINVFTQEGENLLWDQKRFLSEEAFEDMGTPAHDHDNYWYFKYDGQYLGGGSVVNWHCLCQLQESG